MGGQTRSCEEPAKLLKRCLMETECAKSGKRLRDCFQDAPECDVSSKSMVVALCVCVDCLVGSAICILRVQEESCRYEDQDPGYQGKLSSFSLPVP